MRLFPAKALPPGGTPKNPVVHLRLIAAYDTEWECYVTSFDPETGDVEAIARDKTTFGMWMQKSMKAKDLEEHRQYFRIGDRPSVLVHSIVKDEYFLPMTFDEAKLIREKRNSKNS